MPPVLVDLPRLDANLHDFHTRAAAAGCRVRAHLKAHRTREIAVRQVTAGAVGVAVQTASAAQLLAAAGVDDIVLAWPWPEPWRFPLFAEAATVVPRFAVHVDRIASVTGIGAAAAARGVEVGIRIDLRHTPPEQVVPVAEAVASTAGVRLDGVTIYPSVETTADLADRYAVGRRAAEQAVRAAKAISAAGIDCPVVCVGGTPTAAGAWSVAGVTEVCAGAYATWDGGLARHGVGELAQVAISVAAEATDLLAGCGQPWEPEVTSVAAPEPYAGRLLPAHVCPLAVTLVRRQVEITVVDRGEPVAVWRPFAAGDRP